MDILLLRLIHIGAGAFWVGAVFTFFLFVQPAAVAVGPEATKFTYQLLHHRRLPVVILGVRGGHRARGDLAARHHLERARPGHPVRRLAAGVHGGRRRGDPDARGRGPLCLPAHPGGRSGPWARLIAEARPPTPEEQQTLARTGRESRRAGWLVLVGLAIAVAAMATASYWSLVPLSRYGASRKGARHSGGSKSGAK